MKKLFRRLFIIAVCILTIAASGVRAFAEDDEDEYIIANFYTLTTAENNSFAVRFNKNLFKEKATVYSHDLARMSIGLATAAFRPNSEHSEGITSADMNLTKYLLQAHFKDLRSDDYDKDPNMYTVSTVMGHQRIGEGDESFELIAVGVCGQGYIDEWESNFSIGTGIIHDGFSRSSQLVYDRIFGYIANNHLEGPYKVWISGFSRAAAISNITAARLDDSSLFDEDSVFAYTFATPRTTREPKKGSYQNIFNIVGKDDPVPCVPFANWGYERYGIDYMTPVLETDSDFAQKRQGANRSYKLVTGIDYWTNHDADATVRTLLSYLLKICPTVDVYAKSLQGKLIKLWEDRSPVSVFSNILEIANDPLLINDQTWTEANGLLDYLCMLMIDVMNSANMFSSWNNKASTGANLLQAHTPELYVSWLFSADSGEKIYSTSDKYRKVYINTDSTVSLLRGTKIIETLDASEPFVKQDHTYIGVVDGKVTALIPGDEEYSLYIEPEGGTTIDIFSIDYQIGRWSDQMTTKKYGFNIKEGGNLAITFSKDGNVYYSSQEAFAEDQVVIDESPLDIGTTLSFIRSRMKDISWRQMTLMAISVAFFFIALILFQLTFLIGRIRFSHRKRKGWVPKNAKYRSFPYLCVSAAFMLFFIMEFHRALEPDATEKLILYKREIATIFMTLAVYGLYKRRDRLSLMVLISILILSTADILTTENIIIGPLFHIAANIFLAAAFFHEARPTKRQIIMWIIVSAICVLLLLDIPVSDPVLKLVGIVYTVTALLMVTSSFGMHGRAFAGAMLLFVAGCMLMYNVLNGTTFINHLVSLGTYYIAVACLAGVGTGPKLAKLIPVFEEKDNPNDITRMIA